jgi:hypothetical protein
LLKCLSLINSFYAHSWSHIYVFRRYGQSFFNPAGRGSSRSFDRGDSNKHIAKLLDITEATVKMHVKNILTKIRLKNRTQAAVWALKDEGRQLRRATAA